MLLVMEAPCKKLTGPAIGRAMCKKRLCCRLSLPRTSSKNPVVPRLSGGGLLLIELTKTGTSAHRSPVPGVCVNKILSAHYMRQEYQKGNSNKHYIGGLDNIRQEVESEFGIRPPRGVARLLCTVAEVIKGRPTCRAGSIDLLSAGMTTAISLGERPQPL